MKIIKVNIDDIKVYENNAKEHPQWQIKQIKNSIKEFGFNDPIAIDENNVIIEGHGRYIALKELGYIEVDCIKLEHLTEIQKKAYIIAHNKLTMNTDFNFEILEKEINELKNKNFDIDLTGFDISEFMNEQEDYELELDEDIKEKIEPKRDKLICPCCQHIDLKINFKEVNDG